MQTSLVPAWASRQSTGRQLIKVIFGSHFRLIQLLVLALLRMRVSNEGAGRSTLGSLIAYLSILSVVIVFLYGCVQPFHLNRK